MKKPEVKLENFESVYEYYRTHRPNQVLNRVGHAAMALAFHPRVEFASDARETISRLIANGKRIILAANHLTDNDQYVIAALAQHEKPLRPMRGKTFIPSKQPLFKNPLLRRAIDAMDAIPTFRTKDVDDPNKTAEQNDATRQLQRQASKRLIETSIAKLDAGEHMAIFPEGTRNTKQPGIVQPIKPGIGLIATGVSSDTELAIVPTGLYYGQGDNTTRFFPHVYVGQPIVERFTQPEVVMEAVQDTLQASVDEAVASFVNR